jgi:AraC-like DNA-binding protein
MDALSDVLRAAHLTGGVFLDAEFGAPWCIAAKIAPEYCTTALGDAPHLIPYHYVIEGQLHLRLHGDVDGGRGAGPPVVLGAGDVVVLPRNDAHLMGSDLSRAPVAMRDIVGLPVSGQFWSLRHGGDGARTRIACGFLGCDGPDTNPVLASLPPVVALTISEGAAADWIRSTLRFATQEIAAGRPGAETVLGKVSELLFIETVRRYTESLPDEQTGWLAGLRDPHVSRALALIHGDVSRAWTVEDLGREAGLSRSALAERFVRLIGVPPVHYLAQRRMQVAMLKLRATAASLAQVAETVGYESEAAFSRAFKKVVGVAPGAWRRESVAAR